MLNSDAFDYINIMTRAADASYLRETVIANNIANVDTPDYKRKDVDFQSVLKDAIENSRYRTVDEAVRNTDPSDLDAYQYTDAAGFSYRIDKNNVDVDTENVELASEQIRYNALISSAGMDFTRLSTVLK